MPHPGIFPPSREQAAIADFIESDIDEQHDATVAFRTDDPSDGLEYPVHAGKSVGVFKTRRVLLLEIVADQITFDTKLRQSHANDDCPNQTFTDQINAFP